MKIGKLTIRKLVSLDTVNIGVMVEYVHSSAMYDSRGSEPYAYVRTLRLRFFNWCLLASWPVSQRKS